MMKSLTINGTQKRPVAIKKNNAIVSKNSHRVWCIIKVQAVVRRWLAMRLLQKLKQEKIIQQQQQEHHNSFIIPLSPLSSVSSPEIITVSFDNSNKKVVNSINMVNKDEEKHTPTGEILKSEEVKIECLDINIEVREESQKVLGGEILVPVMDISHNGSNTTPFSSRSSSMSSAISMSSSLSSSSLASTESPPSTHQNHQQAILSSSVNSNASSNQSQPITLRKRTIDELLHVERSYVNDMTTCIEVFYKPFKSDELFPKEYLFTMFCNIEEILAVHKDFLESLEKRVSQWDENTCTIGDLFIPFMGSFQKLYEIYIHNYENAFAFTRYIKQSPLYQEVQKSILQKERDSRCRSLDFGSFLVMPIQRLPRYIVLLKEIEKNTSVSNHPDLQQCSLALVQLQDLTLYLNESKRGSFSNEDKLLEIKQSIDGLDPNIIGPNSKFIMEGPLSILKGVVASSKKELYIYLFKEFILCTENQSISVKKSSSLKYNSKIIENTNNNTVNSTSNSSNHSPITSHQNSSNNLNFNPTNRTTSLINLSGPSNTSSTNTSPSTSGFSSPNLNGATLSNNNNNNNHHYNTYSTIRNRSVFKKIQFSDVKAISVLKNFKDSIQVVTSKKVYTFVANSTEFRDKWYNAFNDCLNLRTPPPSPTLPRHLNHKLLNSNFNELSSSNSSSSTTSTTNNRHSIQLQSSPNFQSPTISKKKNRFSIQLT